MSDDELREHLRNIQRDYAAIRKTLDALTRQVAPPTDVPLTLTAVAAHLRVRRHTVAGWITRGKGGIKLEATRLPSGPRVTLAAVERFMQALTEAAEGRVPEVRGKRNKAHEEAMARLREKGLI